MLNDVLRSKERVGKGFLEEVAFTLAFTNQKRSIRQISKHCIMKLKRHQRTKRLLMPMSQEN